MDIHEEGAPAPEAEAHAPTSVRSALEAAFAGDTGGEAAAPAAAAPEAPAAPAAPVKADPTRDEAGKFAKAPEGAQALAQSNAQASVDAAPADGGTTSPPAGWNPAAKAEFAKLPPVVQQAALAREKDISTAKAAWDQKAGEFNRYEEIFGPAAQRAQLHGQDKFQALSALVAASDFLEKSPVDGIAFLAKQYGVDLRRFAQVATQQNGPMPVQDPANSALNQQIQALQRQVQSFQSQTEAQQTSAIQSAVAEFAAKPENLYYENVKADMARLMEAGVVTGANHAELLANAYDAAVHARPDIRPLVLASRAQAEQARAAAEARTRATGARAAGVSITGSPSPGASLQRSGPAPSVRQALEEAFAAQA